MREIKFRVWNKPLGQYINKDYHKQYYLNLDGIVCNFNDFGLVIPLSMDNYIIEQYTGLKDKNGVEIYEGDIVTSMYGTSEVVFGKIGYDDSWNGLTGFALKEWGYDDERFYELQYHFDPYQMEVIGNIHKEENKI